MFTAERVGDPKDYIKGETGDWEIIIGLEVHAQVASTSKLFSGSSTAYGSEPNSQVSLVDAGMPGMLPVLNEFCVEQAVKTGLGLNAQINLFSRFDRKNYFYVDLPQGYQISQFEFPIVGEGEIEILPIDADGNVGDAVTVGIERLHLEQDAGKSVHDLSPDETYVDLNRCGVALMEIVSKPDMRSPEEASAYVEKLRGIVRALGTCDGDMEKGNLRADVNVSVRRPGGELGTRCEIKNVNSMRFIRQAINYEARRHIEIIEAGGTIDQETRLFDSVKGETRTMRSKEDAHDYRYFPDPDLLPLKLEQSFVDRIKSELPEMPDARKSRFMSDYGLPEYDARILTAEAVKADFYESVAKGRDAKIASNWVMGELFGALNKASLDLENSPVSADALGGLLDRIADDTISGKIAKDVFERMFNGEGTADEIIEKQGLKQVTDTGAIAAMVQKVIDANPDQAAAAKENPKLVGFFVGQVMKASQGKANPQAVNKILREKLGL
ncbi:aspartyl/glutamyl-tRNA(Asn/Gln) amidotransferase subunit B [Litorimonas taeanensis]|uniref:Aspartyl/glutamyl-tRNA(Asn/Gln) amidotransferase subunit B n=1 Tax=Litorimonas taeanensis TaxID=568099 RepID=A0A420WLL6_9PROT|nr:Asp-tRNA(Asn)/Glu-tRNA(Gln) amidotransferase subunit GatB [Litorimonas taeanensis]RKQ71914.1 aspartyl/glutamyl-tRNA(Asn/Gln) amidotransferase subunit B [Litorimonas taeanensis]